MTLCMSKHAVWWGGNLRVSSLGELAHKHGAPVFASQACFQHLLKTRKEQAGKPRCPAIQLP